MRTRNEVLIVPLNKTFIYLISPLLKLPPHPLLAFLVSPRKVSDLVDLEEDDIGEFSLKKLEKRRLMRAVGKVKACSSGGSIVGNRFSNNMGGIGGMGGAKSKIATLDGQGETNDVEFEGEEIDLTIALNGGEEVKERDGEGEIKDDRALLSVKIGPYFTSFLDLHLLSR